MDISDELQLALNRSYRLAKKNRHEFVTPEHVLLALLEYDTVGRLFEIMNISVEGFAWELESYLDATMPTVDGENPTESIGFKEILEDAIHFARYADAEAVDIGDVLMAMMDQEESFAAYLLSRNGITDRAFADAVATADRFGSDGVFAEGWPSDFPDEEDGGWERKDDSEILSELTVDLTAAAAGRRLPPFIGREDLLQTVQSVLLRSRKCNPLLIGDPGVGKTALAEGLAQRIVRKKVPPFLIGKKLLSLDVGSLVAGTKYRGEFEMRMKRLLSVLEKDDSVILFIDEIHTLMGAGAGETNKLDAANMLKARLTGGRLICIGATTFEEFKKKIEPEKAFLRRFQVVEIPEPTPAETEEIVRHIRKSFERFHGVRIPMKTARCAVGLADRWLKERRQPDKTIDLLDTVCADVRFRGYKNGRNDGLTVADADLEQTVAKMAGLPPEKLGESDEQRLMKLEPALKAAVFGQDAAVETVAAAVKRAYAGFRKENLPIASLLFIGPTGVGKTELSKQLASALGIDLIRFDMSEYQEKSSVARFIGAPPGYVGYQEGGVLIDAVRRKPNAVLLLDEIEKACPDIFNILLQVMDYAVLTDSLGRKADFSRIVLIMTGNIGSGDWEKNAIGFESVAGNRAAESLKEVFSPEFRNRLDGVVRFNKLSEEQVRKIILREIDLFSARLKKRGVSLSLGNGVVDWLTKKGFSKEFGARPAVGVVETELKALFPDEVLFGFLKNGGRARVETENGRLRIKPPSGKFGFPRLLKGKKNDKGREGESAV